MCLKQLDVTSCNTPGLTHNYILPSVDGPKNVNGTGDIC